LAAAAVTFFTAVEARFFTPLTAFAAVAAPFLRTVLARAATDGDFLAFFEVARFLAISTTEFPADGAR
jgi:hypothetical protein